MPVLIEGQTVEDLSMSKKDGTRFSKGCKGRGTFASRWLQPRSYKGNDSDEKLRLDGWIIYTLRGYSQVFKISKYIILKHKNRKIISFSLIIESDYSRGVKRGEISTYSPLKLLLAPSLESLAPQT